MTPAAAAEPGRPFVIPVFIPYAGCPHRCVFCNQTEITQAECGAGPSAAVRDGIEAFLKHKGPGRSTVQIAFYGGNFLGQAPDEICRLLDVAEGFVRSGDVDGIRFSTRPDTVTPDRLDLLAPVSVDTVELGVQSMDDGVLAASRRGHTAGEARSAVRRLKSRGLSVGLQLMVGLPGDSPETSLRTTLTAADLAPDFVRIYPTLVLKESRLALWHRQGRYTPLSLEAAVDLVSRMYGVFMGRGIPVVRMGLQASSGLDDPETVVAGPYHPAFGHLVLSELFLKCAAGLLAERRQAAAPSTAAIEVHPRNISRMRGLGNKNVEILKAMFHIDKLKIIPNPAVSTTAVRVERTDGIFGGAHGGCGLYER